MIYIFFLFFTFIIIYIALYHLQYFLVFTPTYYKERALNAESCELLTVVTEDKVKLEGVVYTPEKVEATILFFAGRSHDSVALIGKLSESFQSARVITFNYRSYGRSEGEISEKNLLEDALLIAKLVQKNYGEFYLVGFSLGSIAASYVASQQKCHALFLIGTFDSLSLLVQRKYGVNLSWILRYKLDNREYVKRVEAPTHIFASESDEITYIENVKNLQQYVQNLDSFIVFKELSHRELLWNQEVLDRINKEISV